MRNPITDYNPQYENFLFDEMESGEAEWSGEAEAAGVFSAAQELELASELLEVRDEAELDRFLGSLIRNAGSAIGKAIDSPLGRAVGGVLKGAAKQALPMVGGALGGYVGGPLGARIGSGLASAAGQALGLELEGLSQEDREFEAAKQFVRFAGETVKNAATTQPATPPTVAAKSGAAAAARRHAPGLLKNSESLRSGGQDGTPRGHGGRWIRRGRTIVIVNC